MGTDPKILEELLSQTRKVGVEGVEVILTTPSQVDSARVRRAAADLAPAGASPAEMYEAACECATQAVAATLLLDGHKHPTGDRTVAGRLVRLAVADETDVLFGSDLTREALELCGMTPNPGKGEDGQDPPA